MTNFFKLQTENTRRTWLLVVFFFTIASLLELILWFYDTDQVKEQFIGPPRSDYYLTDFVLTAFDKQGDIAYTAQAPRLARHTWLGTFAIEQPVFTVADRQGQFWHAVAMRGVVNPKTQELLLQEHVVLNKAVSNGSETQLNTETLTIKIKEQQIHAPGEVHINQTGGYMQGKGLYANLNSNQFALLSQVTGHYETSQP